MSEQELAAEFNRELDALLEGGRPASFPQDQGAMDLAAALAAADFSAETSIKVPLRSRLLPGSPLEGLLDLFRRPLAGAAFAAAALAVILLPLALRRQPPPAAEPARAVNAVPQAAAPVPSAEPLPAPAKVRVAPGVPAWAGGLFAGLPMGRLEPEPLREFPIGPAGSGLPMITAAGRPIAPAAGGRLPALSAEPAEFPIENRKISPEDLFERRVL